jgi:hypothetical protein
MSGRLIAAWLAGLLLAGGAAADEGKGLSAVAGKPGSMKSYSFVVHDKQGGATGKPVEGKYQGDQPVWFKAEGIQFFRKKDVLVYLDGGKWQRSRTGTLSDPLRILGPSARVRKVTALPHEELAGLAKDLTDVKKTAGKAKGKAVYTGKLTAAALKKWAPTEVRGVAREGAVKVETANGAVVGYTVTLRLKGRLGNADVDGVSTRTVELRDVGSAKVSVPKEASKALE